MNEAIEAARWVTFTPDSSRLLVATLDNKIQLIDVMSGNLIHEFLNHRDGISLNVSSSSSKESSSCLWLDPNLSNLSSTIRTMTVSQDGQWLASGDNLNRIFIYHLDSLQLHATIPVREVCHVNLSFEPHHNNLMIVYANLFFVIYDLDQRDFTDFSRRYPSESDFPQMYLNRKEKISGITFDPTIPDLVVLYGLNFMCFINVNKVNECEDEALKYKPLILFFLAYACQEQCTNSSIKKIPQNQIS